ncbi:MAG: twin-arginine translocase TatA/TatE family subunit [Rhodopirellula sp.]|nr:twin-arginine translocase TatA/TatE family subunit [Rhodopirellula sp.]
MYGIGPMELLIVGGIALLLFGNRLPSVMRSLGRGIVEFKKGVQGIEDDIDKAGSEKIETQKQEKQSVGD